MARIKFSERTLERLGFQRVDLGDGYHDMVLTIGRGWSINYGEGSFELSHDGHSVPLRCRGAEHLRQIIQVL